MSGKPWREIFSEFLNCSAAIASRYFFSGIWRNDKTRAHTFTKITSINECRGSQSQSKLFENFFIKFWWRFRSAWSLFSLRKWYLNCASSFLICFEAVSLCQPWRPPSSNVNVFSILFPVAWPARSNDANCLRLHKLKVMERERVRCFVHLGFRVSVRRVGRKLIAALDSFYEHEEITFLLESLQT